MKDVVHTQCRFGDETFVVEAKELLLSNKIYCKSGKDVQLLPSVEVIDHGNIIDNSSGMSSRTPYDAHYHWPYCIGHALCHRSVFRSFPHVAGPARLYPTEKKPHHLHFPLQ